MATKLELTKDAFFPWLFAEESLSVSRLSATSCRFAGFLWSTIGQDDRNSWSPGDWQNHLSSPSREFYAVFVDEEPAGCCELARQKGLMRSGDVRINAFGLLPEFQDETLRAALLTKMIEKSLATGAKRVTLAIDDSMPAEFLNQCRSQGFRVLG